ncbi:MAG: glycosyltransferase [Geobacteraceae bacterium]|nr:glycosyltransferase [Geobacteraceae bacterium]
MDTEKILFSVVVPSCNRSAQLLECLQALALQEYDRDFFEVLVVLDGCDVPRGDRWERLHGDLHLTVLRQSHAGPARARNVGASRARGRYLAFTDDDCIPAPDWLGCLAARAAASEGCAFGGKTVTALKGNIFSEASQLLVDYQYSYHDENQGSLGFFTSNNLMVPIERFHAIGGFDTSYPLAAGEDDREFCRRWQESGFPMAYAPEAVVYHAHAMTTVSFARQQFNYGRGSYLYHRPKLGRARGFEPFSFYLKLFSYPFRHAEGMQKLSLTGLFVVSQLFILAGYLREVFVKCGAYRKLKY